VLGAIRSDSGRVQVTTAWTVCRKATVTSQVFTPRYAVELTSTGPLSVAPSAAMPRMPRMDVYAKPDIKGQPMSTDARFAERHSTGKGWMALSILTRIVRAPHVTGGMACTYARSIRAPLPVPNERPAATSPNWAWGMTIRSKSLPSFRQILLSQQLEP